MNSVSPDSGRSGLRWWHWMLFVLPSIITVATAWGLVAYTRAKDEASGFTYLSDYGRAHIWLGPMITGLTTGAICCVVCGIILGVSTRSRQRVLASIGWTILCALTNLPLAFAGCTLVVSGQGGT